MDLDISYLSFYIDEDDDSVIINENNIKESGAPYVIRRIRGGVLVPDDESGARVSGAASEHRSEEESSSPKEVTCPVLKDDSQETWVSFEEREAYVVTAPVSDQVDRQHPSVYYGTLAVWPEKQALPKGRTSPGEQSTSSEPPCKLSVPCASPGEQSASSEPPCELSVPCTKVPSLEEISLGTLFSRSIDLTRDVQVDREQRAIVRLGKEKSSLVALDDGSRGAQSHQSVEQSCQTSFCYTEPLVLAQAYPAEPERKVAATASPRGFRASPRPFGKTSTLRSPFGFVENSPSSDGVSNASLRRHPLPSNAPFRIPARGATKTRDSPRQTSKPKDSPYPLKCFSGKTPPATPSSAGKVRSPWEVESPVARYIHGKPAPPLVQRVKPKKSPSAKALCAMAVAGVPTARLKLPMAPLSARKYQSSNMGILSKAGVNQYGTQEPFVIKHTVPGTSEVQAPGDIEASVIQVIRK